LCVVGSSDGVVYQDHAAWFYALPNLEKLANLFDLETIFHALSRTFEVLAKKEKTAVKVLVRYT
jgi:hypothetical protein